MQELEITRRAAYGQEQLGRTAGEFAGEPGFAVESVELLIN
ncbi:pre-mRNA splicing factor ATP-dependent RNA helicase Prp43 [Aspergillus luchuensis]|uniref:Pre-mRNA splicing factor ATP-dependent RNA helicase Prp43 n=1 Tax=Aspergillus kawachii TaxID=1069201 RepID=A0A146FCE1_ASPKA|nr:pre-mRNA splicing factor ATP-dependent RNA helicase Prp43 [Aspergillus luchuensis]